MRAATVRRMRAAVIVACLAAAVLCVLGGARVLRMHDVASAVQAVRMTEAVLGLRAPATQRHNLPEASGAA